MSKLTDTIRDLEEVASRKGGIALLAREAEVPQSTARSLSLIGWRSKPVETFDKLGTAARKILAQDEAA